MKLLLSILILILNFGFIPAKVNLSSTDANSSAREQYVFRVGEDYQEYQLYECESGLLTTISVTSMSSLYGEHLIKMSSAALTMSFKIFVSNNNVILSAYGGTYSSAIWTVTSSSLVINTAKQATYTLNCTGFLGVTQKWLRVNISTGQIVVTYN